MVDVLNDTDICGSDMPISSVLQKHPAPAVGKTRSLLALTKPVAQLRRLTLLSRPTVAVALNMELYGKTATVMAITGL